MSKRSRKWRDKDRGEWDKFKMYNYTIRSLMTLAKEGDVEAYEKIEPTLNTVKGVFDDDV